MKIDFRQTIIPLAFATACLFTACSKQVADSPADDAQADNNPAVAKSDENRDGTNDPTAKAPGEEEATVDVKVVSNKEFQDLIAQHAGKVVFVDYWATW
jgi:hypothetical protein